MVGSPGVSRARVDGGSIGNPTSALCVGFAVTGRAVGSSKLGQRQAVPQWSRDGAQPGFGCGQLVAVLAARGMAGCTGRINEKLDLPSS